MKVLIFTPARRKFQENPVEAVTGIGVYDVSTEQKTVDVMRRVVYAVRDSGVKIDVVFDEKQPEMGSLTTEQLMDEQFLNNYLEEYEQKLRSYAKRESNKALVRDFFDGKVEVENGEDLKAVWDAIVEADNPDLPIIQVKDVN